MKLYQNQVVFLQEFQQELLYDGFSLEESAEVSIYPQYSADGGADSERTFVKQLVQKYVGEEGDGNLFNDVEDGDGGESINV